jgi:hypothetical protein
VYNRLSIGPAQSDWVHEKIPQQNTMTKYFSTLFIFFVFMCRFSVAWCADHAIFTPKNEEMQSLTGQYDFLEDSQGTLTFDQVTTTHANQFKRLVKKNLGFGYKKVLWIRFAIDFHQYKEPYWFLTQNMEHVGELSLFYPSKDGYQSKQMLESTPVGQRAFTFTIISSKCRHRTIRQPFTICGSTRKVICFLSTFPGRGKKDSLKLLTPRCFGKVYSLVDYLSCGATTFYCM